MANSPHEKIRKLNADIVRLEQIVQKLETENSVLKKRNVNQTHLKKTIVERQNEIAKKNEEISNLKKKIKELESQLPENKTDDMSMTDMAKCLQQMATAAAVSEVHALCTGMRLEMEEMKRMMQASGVVQLHITNAQHKTEVQTGNRYSVTNNNKAADDTEGKSGEEGEPPLNADVSNGDNESLKKNRDPDEKDEKSTENSRPPFNMNF